MGDNRPWNEDKSKPYSISLWYDTPGDSDSCSTGCDFATEKEARLCLADMGAHFSMAHFNDVPFILLDGPGVHEVTTRTKALERCQRERERGEREARSEMAMQAGMGMGIHAYNDAMGYDSEPYDPDLHERDDGPCSEE